MVISEVQIAEQIARQAHAGQVEESTGDPYIRHIERVVNLVSEDRAKAVAWLHDVISLIAASYLRERGIDVDTIHAVVLLSRSPATPYENYIQWIKDSGNPLALEVKLADLKDHLRPNCPPRLRPRYEAAWRMLTGEDPPSL